MLPGAEVVPRWSNHDKESTQGGTGQMMSPRRQEGGYVSPKNKRILCNVIDIVATYYEVFTNPIPVVPGPNVFSLGKKVDF
ncbi:hypothetical protein KPH14_008578 [Odynerus spinipes]|uniref:Uncharacterized protein n=1 Tax=Odynerus spinipes TaxID=1348599 RepID=A0AAD9RSF9_9HYME|nr:hypothetical protein KPH14_008578 [Odynerus spinipes]